MAGLRRACAVLLFVPACFFGLVTAASADHCPPVDNPDPIPGQNTTYCHQQPTPAPTPKATPKATTAPAPTPARTAAPAPRGPVTPSRPVSTPAQTPFEIEVPEEEALATPEIVVDGPIEDGESLEIAEGETAGAASNWIFGFIVGFVIGGFIGRASWGIRRRRRQQIFG